MTVIKSAILDFAVLSGRLIQNYTAKPRLQELRINPKTRVPEEPSDLLVTDHFKYKNLFSQAKSSLYDK